MTVSPKAFEQKIVYSRPSLWPPFYTVGMVARIQGNVPVELARRALRKLRILQNVINGARLAVYPNRVPHQSHAMAVIGVSGPMHGA